MRTTRSSPSSSSHALAHDEPFITFAAKNNSIESEPGFSGNYAPARRRNKRENIQFISNIFTNSTSYTTISILVLPPQDARH
jgi:hypothetical protein